MKKEGITHRAHRVKNTLRIRSGQAEVAEKRDPRGEISTGGWRICNFALRIAGMKRKVGLCLVAFLPA